MHNYPYITALFLLIPIASCQEQSSGYVPASSISKAGLARSAREVSKLAGQEIKVWGFVDHRNIYGDLGTKAVLNGWWSGYAPKANSWAFNLKVNPNDKVGHSFKVYVPNDVRRDILLRAFMQDARTHRPTKVYLTGQIFTFTMPTNLTTQTGLYMELKSSEDILLDGEMSAYAK